jgi:hypothetical protein
VNISSGDNCLSECVCVCVGVCVRVCVSLCLPEWVCLDIRVCKREGACMYLSWCVWA